MSNLLVAEWVVTRDAAALRRVTCEQCGREYFFNAIRSASGSGTSILWLDNSGAKHDAAQAARKNARASARNANDPVPCPHCGRVQEAAIRETAHRRVKAPLYGFAFFTFLVVTIVTVMTIKDLKRAPDRDKAIRIAIQFVGIGGGFGVAGIIGCLVLRRRFNRVHFEMLPPQHKNRLAPPALLCRDDGDDLVYYPAKPVALIRRGQGLIVQPSQAGLPRHCLGCGTPTSHSFKPPIALSPDSESYPCCGECESAGRVRWWTVLLRCATIVMGIAAVVACLSWEAPKAVVWGISMSLGLVVALVAGIVSANVYGVPLARRSIDKERGWIALQSRSKIYQRLLEDRFGNAASYEQRVPKSTLGYGL